MDGVDAGWHADPSGRHEYRYWDGSGWTDQASDNGVSLLDPLAAPSSETASASVPAPKRKSVGAIAAIAGAAFLGLLVVLAAIGAATSKPKSDGGKATVVAASPTTSEITENTEAPTTTTTAEPTTTTAAPTTTTTAVPTTTTAAPTTTTRPAPPTTSAPVTAAPRVTSPPATAAPVTAAPATTANSGVYYANCTDARAAGAAPLTRGQPGYRDGLDRDHDGVACE
jgi:cytoskeletal protein RodZ